VKTKYSFSTVMAVGCLSFAASVYSWRKKRICKNELKNTKKPWWFREPFYYYHPVRCHRRFSSSDLAGYKARVYRDTRKHPSWPTAEGCNLMCDAYVWCICANSARQTLLTTRPVFTETLETTLSDKAPTNKICRRVSSEQRCSLDARRQILFEGALSPPS